MPSRPRRSRGTSIEIVHPSDLTSDETSIWRAFIAQNSRFDTPYLDPDYARTLGDIVVDAKVAIFHDHGMIRGFFPYQERPRAIHPLGAPLNDYHCIVGAPDESLDPGQLAALLGSNLMWIPGWCGPADRTAGMTASRGLISDVGQNWSGWYAKQRALHSKYFRDKERARRSLERDHGPVSIRFERGGTSEALRELIHLKRRQYQRTLQHDVFECGWTIDVLEAFMAVESGTCQGSVAVLEAGGQPIAYEYGLVSGATRHFWIPAYKPEFARYSPGILLSLETIRNRSQVGETRFDMGTDAETYKSYFANAERQLLSGFAHAPGSWRGTLLPWMGPVMSRLRNRVSIISACDEALAQKIEGVGRAARSALQRSPLRAASVAT
jgi:CelD/BcsL family acetyltransferase involved in cellulose biosynthesis